MRRGGQPGVLAQRRLIERFRALVVASWVALLKIVVVPCVGFALAHFAMKLGLGVDAFRAFQAAFADAVAFNERKRRAYDIWLVHSLFELFIGMGVVSALG